MLAENYHEEKVKRIRSDKEREHFYETLKSNLEKKGIHHETTITHTPSQNVVGERLKRTLFEKPGSLVAQLKVENKKLWGKNWL